MLVTLGVSGLLFYLKKEISLSVTRGPDWYPGNGDAHVGSTPLYSVNVTVQPMGKGYLKLWVPVGLAEQKQKPQLFVMGDSHSLTYYPALRRFAEDTGSVVSAYFVQDCTFLSLRESIRHAASCDGKFYQTALADLVRRSRAGDVFFMPDLRMPRFIDQMGPVPFVPGNERMNPVRQEATREAIKILQPLANRGVQLLFESPTPVFKTMVDRCADWFNRSNSVCKAGFMVPRREMDILRATPLAQISTISHALRGVSVWNAFDILCPTQHCLMFHDGHPLFFDGDHLSDYGQRVLYYSFREKVRHLMRTAK